MPDLVSEFGGEEGEEWECFCCVGSCLFSFGRAVWGRVARINGSVRHFCRLGCVEAVSIHSRMEFHTVERRSEDNKQGKDVKAD